MQRRRCPAESWGGFPSSSLPQSRMEIPSGLKEWDIILNCQGEVFFFFLLLHLISFFETIFLLSQENWSWRPSSHPLWWEGSVLFHSQAQTNACEEGSKEVRREDEEDKKDEKKKIGKMMSKLSSFVLILHFLFFSFACRDLQVVSVDPGVATPLTVWHANKGAAYQVSLIFPFIS